MKRSLWLGIAAAMLALPAWIATAAAETVTVTTAEEVIESTPGGAINWTARRIEARGSAEKDQSPFRQQITAEIMARANLLKVLDGVRIKAERIVRDGRLKGELTTEHIEGILRHTRVSPARVNGNGLMEVTAYAYLDNDGRPLLLPDIAAPAPAADTASLEESVSGAPEQPAAVWASETYTGLIVDARGLPVKPALFPRLVREGGTQAINDDIRLSRSDLLHLGYCGYVGSEEKARENEARIGTRPFVIRASGVSSNGVDIFLGTEDADRLVDIEARTGILENGRVMIVVGS